MKGNNVAHSKLRTKRDFSLNLKNKRFWSEEEQRYITHQGLMQGHEDYREERSRGYASRRSEERID